jgi:hypothetical protein
MLSSKIRLICLSAFVLLAGVSTLPAQTIPSSYYGWMDQYSITEEDFVGDEACVPTSSTNAMTLLQNLYPSYFGTSLTGNDYASWKDTDKLLITPAYFDTTVGNGTYDDALVTGLVKYITVTAGFSNVQFAGIFPANDGWDSQYPEPDFITNGKPDASFLSDALADDAALLIGITYTNGDGGHDLLVNGFDWDSGNDTGTISIIDPLDPSQVYSPLDTPDGPAKETDGTVTIDSHGKLLLTYDQYQGSLPYDSSDYEVIEATIDTALLVNVPEPSTFAYLAVLAPAALIFRRFCRRPGTD